MAGSLASRTQETKIIQRLAEIEQTVQELRANQTAKLDFNGITLDGTGSTGVMTSGTGNVIDATGLVSTINFPKTQIFNGSAGLTTTSTSMVDVSGGSIGTIITDRTIQVLFYLMGYGFNDSFITSDTNANMEMSYYDSFLGGSIANVIITGASATNVTGGGTSFTMSMTNQMVSQFAVLSVASGTHNYKLQYAAAGSGTAYLNAFLAGYIVLGS